MSDRFKIQPEYRIVWRDQHRLGLKPVAGKWVFPTITLLFVDTIGLVMGLMLWLVLERRSEWKGDAWVVPVAFSAAFLFVIGMTFLLGRALVAALTEVEFLLEEKMTVLTLFGFFRQRIPELPSWIEISSHHTKFADYTGWAVLRFTNRRTKIVILGTRFNRTSEAADRSAAEAVADIREALHLRLDLPDEDAMTPKDRWQSFFAGLLLVGFACVFFYAPFHARVGPRGRPIIPDPHAWGLLFDRLIFSGAGTAFASLALVCFWMVAGPSRLPTVTKTGEARFYRVAAGAAFLWGTMGIYACVLGLQSHDRQAFLMRLVVLVGVPCGLAVSALVKAGKVSRRRAADPRDTAA